MIFYFKKIYAYGIRGNIYDWFKSYLKIIRNMFLNNKTPSDIGNITHGVPKGSILGPLLFILYMNDYSRVSNRFFSILYADNTNIFIEGTEYHKKTFRFRYYSPFVTGHIYYLQTYGITFTRFLSFLCLSVHTSPKYFIDSFSTSSFTSTSIVHSFSSSTSHVLNHLLLTMS